ncbi:uncharacterized protein LOC134854535 [Symsagittifera roscoffensis]|uniref:uncharacterized protein LOC134854535 n=1 Tax=Symsagittifera roscoffensis TaxID=84072 RepID=UPI00307B3C78
MMPMNEEKTDMNRSENSSMSSMISATGIYFYPWVSLLTLIFTSFFGSVGNLIVVTVYGLKRNKNASECFILQLACLDLWVSVFYMPVSVFEILTDSRHALVCLVDKGGAFAYVTASFVMFICIATDRLIAVNKPHSYKTIMNSSRVKLLSGVSVATGVVSALPIGVSCFTETTQDDFRTLTHFKMFYSAVVLLLVLFLTGAYINVFVVARKTLAGHQYSRTGGTLQLDQGANCRSNGKEQKVKLSRESLGSSHAICTSTIDADDLQYNQEDSHDKDLTIKPNEPESCRISDASCRDKGRKVVLGGGSKAKIEQKKKRNKDEEGLQNSEKDHESDSESSSDKQDVVAKSEHLRRMKRDRNVRKQWQIAITLFLVTFVFILCYAPSAIVDLGSWHEKIEMPNFGMRIEEVLFSLLWYSVPANPIIYGFTSPRFRKETRMLMNRAKLFSFNTQHAI